MKKHGRAGQSSTRNEAPRAHAAQHVYSKPEERKCVTGSVTGKGSRLKIQRATAKPNAA